MDAKGIKTLDDFRGRLSEKNVTDHRGFERAQYVKAFAGLGVAARHVPCYWRRVRQCYMEHPQPHWRASRQWHPAASPPAGAFLTAHSRRDKREAYHQDAKDAKKIQTQREEIIHR